MTASSGISRILALKTKLNAELQCYIGHVISGETFQLLVTDVCDCLPSTFRRDIINESLWSLAGQVLNSDVLESTCWRLAGNLNRLKNERVVTPWTKQKMAEWVPAQIISAKPRRNDIGNFGAQFKFKILAGSPCPAVIVKFWSSQLCRFIAPELGFARRRPAPHGKQAPSRQFVAMNELVTLRMELLIEPMLCSSEPGFKRIRCKGSLLDYNKTQLKYRDRLLPGFECRFGMPSTTLCCRCVQGFVSCPGGCHRYDYSIKACTCCRRDQAPFDSELSDTVCVDCYNKQAYGTQK